MRNKIITVLFLLFSVAALAAPELDLAKKSLAGDYQSQRNLAFSYSNGWGVSGESDFIPKNAVHACAWRKIVLLTNTDKAGDADYSNESLDCKNVSPTENKNVWILVFGILQEMTKQQ